ncbi:PilZ domain-containing protein [Pseudobacteriovorax antillogorgiicola]|uniref:PilZ domain-containing protein n=1 Tax=Pseudobacteriovorax antillogorgiicola TaxID=1513793 RepID=A0A1Y6CPA6_9BACT|nr:PilZ domain-containing protein [Pseudobacteriovorax antillogorgiicola]TCS43626.1 PilZ domain-containing protein [Pseudobacteriovorax antillogorgiicola]SMF80015.1 PilZ domain-containing protein [Pseudobacteriovorax antillogorgiicola]
MIGKSKGKTKKKGEAKEQRRYFRIEYPLSHRPEFVHKIGKFPIFDLSEGGLSFQVAPEYTFMETEKVTAEVRLVSGVSHTIKGRVIRVIGRKIIIEFIDPVPLSKIMEEERFLVQRQLLRAD